MIYLQLFFTFLKVGAFAFGGGYAMLSLIGDSVLKYGWMTEQELLNFVGVETVIPGPIAVNMATYIGYEQGGFLGALLGCHRGRGRQRPVFHPDARYHRQGRRQGSLRHRG